MPGHRTHANMETLRSSLGAVTAHTDCVNFNGQKITRVVDDTLNCISFQKDDAAN